MTYSLPFELKQKPINHYLENGVIKFSCREGKLYCKAIYISKKIRFTIEEAEIKTRPQLETILNMKSFPPMLLISKQQNLEVVN